MPEFHLTEFNGGLSNRIRPHLLQPNNATALVDADVVDGSVRPFSASVNSDTTNDYFNRQTHTGSRSIVKWSGSYYWSDNDTGTLGSDLGYVGIDPPAGLATLEAKERGNRFAGVYQYLFTFETANGFESAYNPIEDVSLRSSINTAIEERTLVPATDIDEFNPSHYKHRKRRGYEEGDMVNYNGLTYRAKSGFAGEKTEGAGQAASNAPRYRKIATWQYPGADSGRHWEDITGEVVTILGAQSILVSDIPQPATGSPVVRTNIFRTIADGGTFYFVDSVKGSTTYLDHNDDVKISLNRTLDLGALNFPPISVETGDEDWTTVGGKYLTVEDGTFYLAYGDRVYLSAQDNPHGWDPARFLEFDDTVTGIAAEDRGVLVFTNNRTYHVTGTKLSDVVRRWVPNYQGCPNWRTISYLFDVPIWMSNDGLTKFGYEPNISVERISVLSEKIHTFSKLVTFAVVANDIYYAFRSDGKCTCVDFRRGGIIYERSLDADDAVYDGDNDRLLIKKGGQVKIVDDGDPLTYEYVSGDLNFGTAEPKRLRSVYINASDDTTVTAHVDGELKFTSTSKGTKDRRLYFTPGLVGDYFRIGFSGTGEVRRASIEYNNVQKQR